MAKNQNRSSEDWLPIKTISDGMIKLNNDWMVTGIKVEPKNIFILEENDQFNVIDSLKDLYNTMDFEFWTIMTDRPVHISVYFSIDSTYFTILSF